ncbi:cell division protein ZapE [Litorivicinus lipolyticus]|uniref:Cell division protein ZapE n=1 Tax=Litorivicinus lipolyticus TaxID=418701 RepID=A0A5Q2QIR8_9GAMM|nr:cell division protein ZapE [Litorivicinus lipolyticus]QGG80965.1 cell division protein ZapE [Litorivicinus lipolyticus]
MNPLTRYQALLDSGEIYPDPSQAAAVGMLDQLRSRLINFQPAHPAKGFVSNLLGRWKPPPPPLPERGLYFWGGVGRGKTFLMDLFYDSLPFEDKKRIHFHRFMLSVHAQLREMQGQPDPLERVADRLADDMRVLCLDEFIVTDITDAMILANLFRGLFRRQVALVTTSNVEPRWLYKDGLQRALFLPAIDMLYAHCEVFNLDGGTDWRLRVLTQVELYLDAQRPDADLLLAQEFAQLAPGQVHEGVKIDVNGRQFSTRAISDDVVWFSFKELCQGPRSTSDYIELAKRFHALVVSDVPVLTDQMDDAARRFVNLIDEVYDRNVKLIVSAEAPLMSLYQGSRVTFEFDRTVSRLTEMQSQEYLAQPHLP